MMNYPLGRTTYAAPDAAEPVHFKDLGEALSQTKVTREQLVAALERLAERDASETSALSEAEERFLDAHSGVTPNHDALLGSRIENGIEVERESASALTVNEVAHMLGVGSSRVRHRISEGSLYALPSQGRGTERKLPRWQFVDDESIPHLAQVTQALPEEFATLDVKAFFAHARIDHPDGQRTVNVTEWLISGGAPEPVAELADSLRYTL